jgi:hypothetical protein
MRERSGGGARGTCGGEGREGGLDQRPRARGGEGGRTAQRGKIAEGCRCGTTRGRPQVEGDEEGTG